MNWIYLAIAVVMVILWFSNEDDDDLGGGKLMPAYQRTD